MQPKVTVITPTHNRAEFLKIAMQSVLSSGYENLQFIIIDDGSSKETEEAVAEFQVKYPGKITYIRNEQNLGESHSINNGWNVAQGDYVVTLSDDDLLLPNWFAESVSFMEKNPDIIVGYPDWNKIDKEGNVIKTVHMPEYDFIRVFTTCANMPGPGVIIRRSFLLDKTFLREEKYIYMADYEMWLILATKAPFARIPHITSCWRQHKKSLTSKANGYNKAMEMDRAINLFVNKYSQFPLIRDNSKKIKVRAFLHIVYILCRDHNFVLAAKYGLRAFLESPYWLSVLAWCYISRIVSADK